VVAAAVAVAVMFRTSFGTTCKISGSQRENFVGSLIPHVQQNVCEIVDTFELFLTNELIQIIVAET
jgi:hypothetical protein